MNIALDQIDDTIPDIRRISPPATADAALKRSIAARGVLQPVLLRPNGNRYEVVLGRRRTRFAWEAGLAEVPAEVRVMTDAEAHEAQVIENTHRAALHPIDQWRAVKDLLDHGSAIADAAMACGLDERQTRQMERLAALHPDVLELAEKDMPDRSFLATIAAASPEQQAAALKTPYAVNGDDINWHVIARACRQTRIPRALAIFDVAKSAVVFEEDLFAEPGSPEQFVTHDIGRFVLAQREALKQRVDRGRKRNERITLVGWRGHGIALPQGWTQCWSMPTSRTPKGATGPTKFVAVSESEHNYGEVVEVVANPPAKLIRPESRQGAAAAPGAGTGTGTGTGTGRRDKKTEPPAHQGDTGDETDEPGSERAAITQRGLQMVAGAKTAALRTHIRVTGPERPLALLAAGLVVALAGKNVRIGDERSRFSACDFSDLVVRLVSPAGQLTATDIEEVCSEALARMLVVWDPVAMHGSGDPAEWIGSAIGADAALPRFDTAEFLATLSSAELRALAARLDISLPSKVRELRAALVGKAPDWRPTTFGAPGPQPQTEPRRRRADAVEDVDA